jgi:RNA recognition motif-containing protein
MKIFIASLSFRADDQDLAELFEPYGEVTSASVVLDRETGRSRGFGFVEMPDADAAKAAIAELDGAEVDGRTIVVKEAEDRKGGGGGGGHRGGGGGGRGGYRGGGGGNRGGGYGNKGGGYDRDNRY